MSDVSFYLDALRTHRKAGKTDREFKQRINKLYLIGMIEESVMVELSKELVVPDEPDKSQKATGGAFPSVGQVWGSRAKAASTLPPASTYTSQGGCEGDGGCSGPPKSRPSRTQNTGRCGNHAAENNRCGTSNDSNGRC